MINSKVPYLKSPPAPRKKEFYEKSWFKAFIKALNLIFNIFPSLRRYVAKTASGMLVNAHHNLKIGNYNEAFQLCSEGLIKYRHKTDYLGHYDWWEFMRIAVYAVDNLDEKEQKGNLINLAENGVLPFEGFSVAASFCIFSRWKYKEKDYDAAIVFADRAVKADESYAEAHALLGWYKLFIKQSDPVEHFIAAVNCDNEYLAKIINAPEMSNFPNILSELRKLKLVKQESMP